MNENAFVSDCAREDIGDLLNVGRYKDFVPVTVERALSESVRSKAVRLGFWSLPGSDPLPDFMIVPDADQTDTLAWLSAFMGSLAPISQWCRIFSASEAQRLSKNIGTVAENFALAPWVGAIIAECGSNLPASAHLKDVSAAAAISGPTFAAGRSINVWGGPDVLGETATRYDELARRFRDASKNADAKSLSPLWRTLAGEVGGSNINEARSLTPFAKIFRYVGRGGSIDIDNMAEVARDIGQYVSISLIEQCAIGPQSRRVGALDQVAKRLLNGPSSPAISAILGFSASLVDPGAAVLPELLRQYSNTLPAAAIWSGAFAGAWSPMRVLTENGGIGRIISKELIKKSDIFSKPSADIGYEELIRWIGQAGDGRSSIKGFTARLLNVELVLGVTVPFPSVREPQRNEQPSLSAAPAAQRAFELDNSRDRSNPEGKVAARPEAPISLASLNARLETLESVIASLTAKNSRAAGKPSNRKV